MSILSKIAPSSSDIQKAYVKKRQRALYPNDPAKTKRVQDKIEALMKRKSFFDPRMDWHDVYLRIHTMLQRADLTINFNAGDWFKTVNKYPTYAQTYERAMTGGKLALKDDKYNPAVTRAVVDDMVTLPEEWAHALPFTERRRLYDAMNVTGAWKGTNPDGAKLDSKPGAKTPQLKLADKNDDAKGVTTKNKSFKPKAKQVFAGLNYGRRPHGASTYYGFSHLVLNPVLKRDALYFPEDTFYVAGNTAAQATFNTIGAVIDKAKDTILDGIWKSCFHGHTLEDSREASELLEAHIFRTVKMNQDVQSLVLSRQSNRAGDKYTHDEWMTIGNNANEWCKRNGVRLLFASP